MTSHIGQWVWSILVAMWSLGSWVSVSVRGNHNPSENRDRSSKLFWSSFRIFWDVPKFQWNGVRVLRWSVIPHTYGKWHKKIWLLYCRQQTNRLVLYSARVDGYCETINIDILFTFHKSTIKTLIRIQNMSRLIHFVKF